MPATTWALVTTFCDVATQPLPSWPRLQAWATPVILTIDPATALIAGPAAVPPFGGSTGWMGSGESPSKTRGKPLRSSIVRKPAKSCPVAGGTTRSIVRSTCDSPIARASGAGAPPRTAPAMNQTRTETAATTATEPSRESMARSGLARTRERARLPTATMIPWPREARRKTPRTRKTMRTTSRSLTHCELWSSEGRIHIPSAPPPRNPSSDKALTTSPCR